MDILLLFRELAKEEPLKAQIVGKNILYNNPKNEAIFEEYFIFCLKNAEEIDDENICKFFLKEAEQSLQDYSQQCDMTSETLEKIIVHSNNYSSTVDRISNKNRDHIIANNKKLLKDLQNLLEKLEDGNNLEGILNDLKVLDSMLDKDLFDEKEKEIYKSTSTKIADLISAKMKEEQNRIAKEALDSFKICFDEFCNDKKYKKDEEKLLTLVGSYLFNYDINTLPPEVIMFHNYVRDYIFNNVREELKYKLVKCSIECKK